MTAAEESATTYKDTIDSHASDYKKSGEQAAIKTADGATSKQGEFKSAGEKAADEYTITIDSKSGKFIVTGNQMAETTASGSTKYYGNYFCVIDFTEINHYCYYN